MTPSPILELLEGMEEEIREKAIEFDHDPRGDREPDRGKHGCGGEELLHGVLGVLTVDGKQSVEPARGDLWTGALAR